MIFCDGWETLLRIHIVGLVAYVALMAFLRIAGKRTLSKMNAFDSVVTVALGSTLAAVLHSKDVALAEGALAFALLIVLQFAVTWTSVRIRWVRRVVTGDPLMLLYRGQFLSAALMQARVTEDEWRAAIRSTRRKRSFWKPTARSASSVSAPQATAPVFPESTEHSRIARTDRFRGRITGQPGLMRTRPVTEEK